MTSTTDSIELRSSTPDDLDFVLSLERDSDNRPFIGQWSREEHLRAMARADRLHRIVELGLQREPVGYLIAYDLTASSLGVYLKRIVIRDKSRGFGRAALRALVAHAQLDRAADSVWLSVFADNLRAQRAYASVGFAIADLAADEREARRAAVGGFSDRSVVMIRALGRPVVSG